MKGKKLISVFTCSFLLLGGGTLLAVQSASKGQVRRVKADTDLGTINFTGVISGNAGSITFFAPQENDISNDWSAMNFVSGTVTLNSDDISSGAKIQKANNHDYYFPIGSDADVDDIVTIDAKFSGEDGEETYIFEVPKVQAQWDGTAWKLLNQDVGTVAFGVVSNPQSASNLYIKGQEKYEVFPQTWDSNYCAYYPVSGSGYVKLNDTVLNDVRMRKVPEIQPGYYWYLELNATATEGDVVTIGGDWAGGGFKFTITEFSKTWNGSAWAPMQRDAGTITLTDVRSVACTIEHIYTYGSDNNIPFSGSWDYPFTPVDANSGVFVDGVKQGDSAIKKIDIGVYIDGVLIPIYYFHVAGVSTGSIFEVKGTFSGVSIDGDNYTFTVPSFSKQWDGSAWGPVHQDAGTVKLVSVELNPASSSAGAIQFVSEGTNDIPNNWDDAYYPQTGASVTLNGNDVTSISKFKKPGPQGYFLEGFGTASVGSIVTVSGEFAGQNGDKIYHFTVEEAMAKFDGTIWQTLDQYKTAAKAALDSYLDEDNYLPADWDTAEQWIANGKDNIDVCEDFANVDSMLAEFKNNLDSIPTRTERAQEAAAEVDALIDSIVDINRRNYEEEKAKVEAARAAYNALSDEAKGYVQYLNLLQGAENRLADIEAAIAVDNLIDAIGTVTLDSEDAINAARAAYDDLNGNQNRYVEKLDVLVAAEDRLAELKELAAYKTQVLQGLAQELEQILPNYREAQQQQIQALALQGQTAIQNAESKDAVDAVVAGLRAQLAEIPTKNELDAKDVDDQIAALPAVANIALTDEDAIVAARAAYDALNSDAKQLVTKLDVLVAAEARLAELKDAKADAEAFDALVEAIGEVTVANNATCQKIVTALNAYFELSDDAYAMITTEDALLDAYDTYVTLLRTAMAEAAERVNEIYDALNMKKYTAENQELLAQLKQQALDYIDAAISETSLGSIEYLDAVLEAYQESINEVPQKKAPAKKGCGGSIVATSIVLSTLALAGLGLAISKKRKED